MDIESVVQSLIHEPESFVRSCAELRQFPDTVITEYVDKLKCLVDENWSKDPHTSLAYANLIIGVGCIRRDRRTLALGMMARGDTVKLVGRMQEAWDKLDLAADLYQQAEDEVGCLSVPTSTTLTRLLPKLKSHVKSSCATTNMNVCCVWSGTEVIYYRKQDAIKMP